MDYSFLVQSKVPAGCIRLNRHCKIFKTPLSQCYEPNKFPFDIITPDRTYCFYTVKEEDQQEWTAVLTAALTRGPNVSFIQETEDEIPTESEEQTAAKEPNPASSSEEKSTPASASSTPSEDAKKAARASLTLSAATLDIRFEKLMVIQSYLN